MRRPMAAGNWKMNGSKQSTTQIIGEILTGVSQSENLEKVDIVVCPPAILLGTTQTLLSGTKVLMGGQNVCDQDGPGAFTGEVSADMLKEFSCSYVIIGHSERRHLYGESDTLILNRVLTAVAHGLTPILCVGELLEDREAGNTESVVREQLAGLLDLDNGVEVLKQCVIAYEPVWAIGTGKTASPQQAQDVHAFIRRLLAEKDEEMSAEIRILYGGSMKSSNALDLISMPDIDGGLIGGAALKADEFLGICEAAGNCA